MDEFDAWLDELQGKGKDTVSHHVLPKGPVDDGVRINDLLDALQGKPDRFRKLEEARQAEVGQDRPAEFLARRSIPFASSLISYALDEDERKAAARFEAGEPLEWDFPKIARMEARQEAERKTGRAGVGRKVASAVASIPSIAGEMAAAAPLAAPIRAGRFAGAVAPELVAGAGRVAVTTAAAPSMYVEDARRRAQEGGGLAIDPENLVPAFAHGAVQTAILGRMKGGMGDATKLQRALSANPATRFVGRTGTGLLESEVAGAAAKVTGLTTHYGTLTELAKGEGDWADAAAHVVTFAAFSALHAKGDKAAKERARNAVLEDFRLQTAKLAGQGFSEKAAGQILKTEWSRLAEASQKPPEAPQAPEPAVRPPAPEIALPEQAQTPKTGVAKIDATMSGVKPVTWDGTNWDTADPKWPIYQKLQKAKAAIESNPDMGVIEPGQFMGEQVPGELSYRGERIVYHRPSVEKIIAADPAYYKKFGSTTEEVIKGAIKANAAGELLGYGTARTTAEGEVAVEFLNDAGSQVNGMLAKRAELPDLIRRYAGAGAGAVKVSVREGRDFSTPVAFEGSPAEALKRFEATPEQAPPPPSEQKRVEPPLRLTVEQEQNVRRGEGLVDHLAGWLYDNTDIKPAENEEWLSFVNAHRAGRGPVNRPKAQVAQELVMSDWLEERGYTRQAELLRTNAERLRDSLERPVEPVGHQTKQLPRVRTAPIEATPESTLQKSNVDVDGPLMKGLGLNERGWAQFQQDNPEVVESLRELARKTQKPKDPTPEERKQYLLDRAMLQGTLNSWKEQAKAQASRAPVAREAEPVPEAVPEPAAPMDPVKEAIGKLDLNERDRSIVERRVAGETMEAIGASVGLTRERVRQIETAAMKKAGYPSVAEFKTAAETRARPDKANAEVKGDRAVEDTVQSDIAAKEAMEAESRALQQEVEGLGLKKERGEGELDKEAALQAALEQAKGTGLKPQAAKAAPRDIYDRVRADAKAETPIEALTAEIDASLANKSKAQLVADAEAMEIVGTQNRSKAEIAEQIKQKIIDLRSSIQRGLMLEPEAAKGTGLKPKPKLLELADRWDAEANDVLKGLGDMPFSTLGGFDPKVVEALAKKVAAKIIKGGYKLADWMADAAKLPEGFKPHVEGRAEEIFARAEALAKGEEYKPAPTRSEGQVKAQEAAVAARRASVLNHIRKAGGIDPEMAKLVTNIKEDGESGMATMYRAKDGGKGRRDPSEVVDELVAEGVIPPLPAEYEYDTLGYLKELVSGKKRSLESDRDKEYARKSEAVDREVAEQAPKAPEAAPFEPEGQRAPVGTKDAAVDAQRAKRGLPPMMKEARKVDQEVWDEAQAIIADDFRATDRLIDEILADPRPARPREEAQLMIREVELSNEYHDTLMALDKAREGGSPERIALFEQSLEDVQARMQRLDEATRKSGASWGRSGRFRQRLAAENFTLVALEARYRLAGGGKAPATQAEIVREQADLKALSESVQKVKELEAKLEAAQAIAERRAVEEMMGAGDRGTGLKPERERKQTAARKEFSEAVAELKKKSKGLFMQADPEAILALAKVAKAAIKLGVAKVQDFVAEFGKETGKELNETQVELLAKAWADAQREIRQERTDTALKTRLENEIKAFETQIETGERQVKEKGTGLRSVEAEMLKKKRDAVKAEYEEKFGVAAEKRVGQLQKRLEKWQDRAAGEPAPERKEPVRTKEIEDLEYEIEKAKKEAWRIVEQKKRDNRTGVEKVGDFLGDVLNLPQLLEFGWDFAPLLRQGLLFTYAHPKLSVKAWRETMPAARKERYERMQHDIQNDPLVKSGAAERWGLEILDVEGPKSRRPEELHTSLGEKIPVVKQVVMPLGRWNTAYKNASSLTWLKTMVAGLGHEGKVSDAGGKVLANAVNVAMGRGNVGQLQAAFNFLNRIYLAPRWVVARIQYAALQPLWTGVFTGNRKGTAAARIKVAKELYVRPALGFAAVAGLALAAREYFGKDEIDFDPDGELRVGNRRYDLSAGVKEWWLMVPRLWNGKMWTPHGTKRTRTDIIAGIQENKLAPIPSAVDNSIRVRLKEPLPGRPKTQAGVAADLVTPVGPKDIYEAFEELGVGEAAATSILNMLGLPGKKYKN